jgi:hypothetical protein
MDHPIKTSAQHFYLASRRTMFDMRPNDKLHLNKISYMLGLSVLYRVYY